MNYNKDVKDAALAIGVTILLIAVANWLLVIVGMFFGVTR